MTTPIEFLEPQFLWALPFIGAILMVHLLKKPRTVRLSFPTLRFFDESAVMKTRSRALRKILLLLVRILLAIIIVIIFAGPFLKSDPLRIIHDPTSDLFIWVDPTPSMDYRESGISITEKANAVVDSIVHMRPDRRRTFVYNADQADFIPRITGEPMTTTKPFLDVQHLEQACSRAVHHSHRPAFIFASDYQLATTTAVEAIVSGKTTGTATILCVPLTPDAPWNCAVGDIGFIGGNEPLILPHVVSSGTRRCSGSLSLSIDNMRSPPYPCVLPPHTDTVIALSAPRIIQAGWGSVTLRCEDPLPFDNSAAFIIGDQAPTAVCIVGNAVESYPIAAALGTVTKAIPVTIATCTHDLFTIERSQDADIIIVNGGSGAERTMQTIRRTPPIRKQTIIMAYDSFPAAGSPGSWKESPSPLTARLTDTLSGVWKGFPSLYCDEAKIYGYRSDLKGTPLLSLSNGTPLCTYTAENIDKRTQIFMATPLGISAHNNLCETGFYVPFIDRIFRTALIDIRERHAPWIAGKLIKNPWYGQPVPVPILDASGKQVTMLQQQPFFTIAVPGVYKVVPPKTAPYYKIVIIDSLEGKLDYRIPVIRSDKKRPGIIISPQELLTYCASRQRSATWLIPWLLLVVLYAAELTLRDSTAKNRHPDGPPQKKGII